MVVDNEILRIDQLFNTSWYRHDEKDSYRLKQLALVFYTPLGLCLFLIRLGIVLQFVLLKQLLPDSKFKRSLLRIMAGILGITISTEGEITSTTFVSNHVTVLDHFVIHLVTDGFLVTEETNVPSYAQRLLSITSGSESVAVSIFLPEEETTNGVRGLLTFSEILHDGNDQLVQPIALAVVRPFLNVNSIHASLRTELFFALFLPNTHYTLKFLPCEPWDAVRVQKSIASNLAIHPTKFRRSDKREMVKKLNFRPPSVASMARLVQQQLHPVVLSPESVISAIQKTGSVEAAVEELRKSITQPSFRKNASERMMSFQERKRLMIETAREKYAQKHGISLQ